MLDQFFFSFEGNDMDVLIDFDAKTGERAHPTIAIVASIDF